MMYRLSEELASYILSHSRNPAISNVDIDSKNPPFKVTNIHAVGLIDPVCAMGTDCDYSLEAPHPIIYPHIEFPAPNLQGFWLYKREELKPVGEPFFIQQGMLDPNAKGTEAQIDVADCAITLPSDVDKLTCKSFTDVKKLLQAEPDLKICLNLEDK